jgi:hypothetical protein
MKKRTFINRHAAALIIWKYRAAVRENIENPSVETWDNVKRYYHMMTMLGMLDITSTSCQIRTFTMFEECTAVL